MQETVNAKIKEGWVCCGRCGHKLGRIINNNPMCLDVKFNALEIKCSSCKQLNIVDKIRR